MRFAVLALAACHAPSAAPPREAPPAWQARPSGGTQPIDPGVAADSELLDAAGCRACHAAIVDEWAGSRHAVAWTNSIFQREYTAEPQAWCVNCHAPLATQQRALDGAHARQGVDCASCHVRGGKLVSARRADASPHATIADPSFGTPAFCADCHQFNFPILDPKTGIAEATTEHPMQTTVASFRAGPYANERAGCLACHGSRAGHAFAGVHDRGMREAALETTWCARGDELALAVTNVAAGHSVPTGDIHRHLYLRVWRSSAPASMFQAFFGRRFEPAPGGGNRTIWDSTIAPRETKRFAVDAGTLGGDAGEPINLELVYVFIADETAPDASATITRERRMLADVPRCR